MRNIIGILSFVVASLAMSSAHALLISVGGPNSTDGTPAAIIAPPTHVLDSMVTNTGQQGFTERRGILLTSDLAVAGGVVAAGNRVDSHLIFLNAPHTNGITHRLVNWTFDGDVLGVMADNIGAQELASTPLLGLPGVIYPIATQAARGFEGGSLDNATLPMSNVLQVTMDVVQPGDWIRVLTVSQVPEPATLALLLPAAIGMAGARRRRSR